MRKYLIALTFTTVSLVALAGLALAEGETGDQGTRWVTGRFTDKILIIYFFSPNDA